MMSEKNLLNNERLDINVASSPKNLRISTHCNFTSFLIKVKRCKLMCRKWTKTLKTDNVLYCILLDRIGHWSTLGPFTFIQVMFDDRGTKMVLLCLMLLSTRTMAGRIWFFPSISYCFHIPKIFLFFFPHTGKNRNRRKSNLLP